MTVRGSHRRMFKKAAVSPAQSPARQDVPFPGAAAASDEAKRNISPALPEPAETGSLSLGGTLRL